MDTSIIQGIVGAGGTAVILALVQLLKPFVTDTRLYPVLATAFGVTINLLAWAALGTYTVQTFFLALIVGLLAGLAAGGLYSAGSTWREGPMADKSKRLPPLSQAPTIPPAPPPAVPTPPSP